MITKKALKIVVLCLGTKGIGAMNGKSSEQSWYSYLPWPTLSSFYAPIQTERSKSNLPSAPPAYEQEQVKKISRPNDTCIQDSYSYRARSCNDAASSSIESAEPSVLSKVSTYVASTFVESIEDKVIRELEQNAFDISDHMNSMHRLDNAIRALVIQKNNVRLKNLLELCGEKRINISEVGRDMALIFIKECKEREIKKLRQEFQYRLDAINLIKREERLLLSLHYKQDDISDTEYDEQVLFGKIISSMNKDDSGGKKRI